MVYVTIYSIEFGGHTYVGRSMHFTKRMSDHYRNLFDGTTKKLYRYLRERCLEYSELCGTTLAVYDIPRSWRGAYDYGIANCIESYWVNHLRADLNSEKTTNHDLLRCAIYHNEFLESIGGPVICLKDAYIEVMSDYVLDTMIKDISEYRAPPDQS